MSETEAGGLDTAGIVSAVEIADGVVGVVATVAMAVALEVAGALEFTAAVWSARLVIRVKPVAATAMSATLGRARRNHGPRRLSVFGAASTLAARGETAGASSVGASNDGASMSVKACTTSSTSRRSVGRAARSTDSIRPHTRRAALEASVRSARWE